MTAQGTLFDLLAVPMQPGTIVWIGLRSARRKSPTSVQAATLIEGQGLSGDHYMTRTNGPRQVTLISAEHLQVVASYLKRGAIDPALLRRNVVVSGINLLALKSRRFETDETLLEYSGECHPCSRMEESLGRGGYNAMRGHGGITARVIRGGEIRVGDSLQVAGALPES